MSGRDKGLMPLQGKPLIAHVLERVAAQTQHILINCNRNEDEYARFGYPLLKDSMQGGLGPLAGLLSALEYSDSDYFLSVPCDTPFLPEDLLERLLQALHHHRADACTVHDGERLHPAIMLVHGRVQEGLRRYLESGKRKVHDWFYSIPHCSADFSDQPQAFVNINTPAQLKAAAS